MSSKLKVVGMEIDETLDFEKSETFGEYMKRLGRQLDAYAERQISECYHQQSVLENKTTEQCDPKTSN